MEFDHEVSPQNTSLNQNIKRQAKALLSILTENHRNTIYLLFYYKT